LLQTGEVVLKLGSPFLIFVDGSEFSKERVVVVKQRRVRLEKGLAPFGGATAETGQDISDTYFVISEGHMTHTNIQFRLL